MSEPVHWPSLPSFPQKFPKRKNTMMRPKSKEHQQADASTPEIPLQKVQDDFPKLSLTPPGGGKKSSMSSRSIPLPTSHVHRTQSELQLCEDLAVADHRDMAMFVRLVNGIRDKQHADTHTPPTAHSSFAGSHGAAFPETSTTSSSADNGDAIIAHLYQTRNSPVPPPPSEAPESPSRNQYQRRRSSSTFVAVHTNGYSDAYDYDRYPINSLPPHLQQDSMPNHPMMQGLKTGFEGGSTDDWSVSGFEDLEDYSEEFQLLAPPALSRSERSHPRAVSSSTSVNSEEHHEEESSGIFDLEL